MVLYFFANNFIPMALNYSNILIFSRRGWGGAGMMGGVGRWKFMLILITYLSMMDHAIAHDVNDINYEDLMSRVFTVCTEIDSAKY